MGAQFSQFFPPRPTFTPDDVPRQSGKVVLITGGASGIGFELAKMLYRKGAKVYIGGRSEDNAKVAIQAIQQAVPQTGGENSPGVLEFLPLHLDDLTTIKATADAFRTKESKLDLLFNNAGVSQPPLGSVSKQGIELQLATNCLGPFLLTRLLTPLLEAAAASDSSTTGSVRVVWTSSQVAELSAPPEGIIMSELTNPPRDVVRNYVTSKLGNWCLAAEMARRYGTQEIVSVAQNPGAANTNLLRNARWMKILSWPLLHSPVLAAHTVLYAGLSPDLNLENNGAYVIPWGRIHQEVAPNLLNAMKTQEESGTGRAKEFWEFCEERTRDYM
ncbi:NAD(P)-binding protein [Aspergillus sclerotioniger CBS 115572]|uniref:NAD(P)-binding protein n=1 Tax=Aspergillus sclerotioniger CBS 115572 TaxID=1450535 RepID=A0A317WNG0_9EURO|nr:NAD(P)-binding protein [Aspergillus sclerotioniger CBS 115572]PWY88004.1 NAD(P)-binding protein [Aspergillus sclerotioniger CBS 115572]